MRIANIHVKNEFIGRLQGQSETLTKVQTQMSTGQRIQKPSEDPIAAINSVYHRTRLNQIEQYQKNVGESKAQVDLGHDHLVAVTGILQRVRELTVQSANGTYGKDDRQYMAMEVEELLRESIAAANASRGDQFVFSGGLTHTKPFREFESARNGLGKPLIERVDYQGNNLEHQVEVEQDDRVAVTLPGSQVFWGQNHLVVSLKEGANWVSDRDQVLRIDGQEVRATKGDNLDSLVQKINGAVPSVTAFARELPTGERVLAVESASPHRIQFEDLEGGSVLADLGVIRSGEEGKQVGNNLHPNTLESGGSVFDIMIRLRNSLLANDVETLGSRDLSGLSAALDNVLLNQARLSAVQTRLDFSDKKLSADRELTTERLSKNEDMDIAEATIRYNQIDMVHRVSLMTAAKLLPPTLMDYLR
ncbi:MAG: flagellar hook-associated protein 3 [Spirochaetes bacterium]|nr:flagellar hook-associated protein 3 [Spirochaetota bacterium]